MCGSTFDKSWKATSAVATDDESDFGLCDSEFSESYREEGEDCDLLEIADNVDLLIHSPILSTIYGYVFLWWNEYIQSQTTIVYRNRLCENEYSQSLGSQLQMKISTHRVKNYLVGNPKFTFDSVSGNFMK